MFLAVRAVALALLTAAVVEALEDGRVTRACLRRAIRALPVTFAVCIIGVGILTLSSFFGPLLGPGFGILLQVGALVVGHLPLRVRADHRRRRGTDDAGVPRPSIRAARMPGAGNLMLAALYVVPSIAVIVAPGEPGSLMGVNPSVGAWVFVILINLLHVVAARDVRVPLPLGRPRGARAARAPARVDRARTPSLSAATAAGKLPPPARERRAHTPEDRATGSLPKWGGPEPGRSGRRRRHKTERRRHPCL